MRRPIPALLLLAACAVEPGSSDPGENPPSGGDDSGADTADTAAVATSGSAEPGQLALLEREVTAEGVLRHLDALQAIADASGDNRAVGSDGYDASVAYVIETLEAAGYAVTLHGFPLSVFNEHSPPVLEVSSPDPTAWTGGEDFESMTYAAAGDVTAALWPIDLVLPPGEAANTSTSACEAADFDGFPDGAVALIQRGTCPFVDKVRNAERAGASAVVLFNEGQEGRTEAASVSLSSSSPPAIPGLSASFAVGEALAGMLEAGEVVVRVVVDASNDEETITSVLAETAGGDPSRVVMVGAHLDSVAAGPGINDNGSGTATVLEMAVQAAAIGMKPRNRLRFAWWGAEELGLIGSSAYVEDLDDAEANAILAYLNFDMVGSPGGERFVYDGDGSHTGGEWASEGSGEIEGRFNAWLDGRGLAHGPTAFDGRSDYAGFLAVGVPSGGLFTGAGSPWDGCYHQACDTIDNIDPVLLGEMAQAAARVTRELSAWEGALGSGRRARLSVSPWALTGACHDPAR